MAIIDWIKIIGQMLFIMIALPIVIVLSFFKILFSKQPLNEKGKDLLAWLVSVLITGGIFFGLAALTSWLDSNNSPAAVCGGLLFTAFFPFIWVAIWKPLGKPIWEAVKKKIFGIESQQRTQSEDLAPSKISLNLPPAQVSNLSHPRRRFRRRRRRQDDLHKGSIGKSELSESTELIKHPKNNNKEPSMSSLPLRSAVDKNHTWNAESVFDTPEAWSAEVDAILADLPKLKQYEGRLKEGASVLADAFAVFESLNLRGYRAYMYAGFAYAVDTTDQNAAGMAGKAQGMFGQISAAGAFLNPELLAIGQKKLAKWVKEEPRLAVYGQFFDNLFRKQAHVRSGEVEEILGLLNDPFGGSAQIASMLTNADMKIPSVLDSAGNVIELEESAIWKLMFEDDRALRQKSWENYHATLLTYKNTLATNLATSIKQNVFLSRVRKHENALEMMLYENNIPVSVFHNLLATFKKHLPIWHKYFDVRRKALGVDTLQPYDMWAPLTKDRVKIPYQKAVEHIAEGLLPMGKDYVGILRNGALEERWVDIYPNKGKRTGAFSWGAPGTHPFIMMSYTDEIFSLSTLAHELGHSMHSYLTWQNQPIVYAEYSLFVAEVASNFHQAMVRAHLLQSNPDKNFQIAVIEEAMANFYRYFFIMPTLARFELETHTRIEQGQPLTADSMIQLMADLFTEGYGGKVEVNREHVGITWSRFGHLFTDYYVYAYATGIAGAHALAKRVLNGEPNAVENYLGFLKSGSSVYPLDVLKQAGVDLTTPAPVDAAFEVMADYVNRLEKLLA